MPMSFKGVVVGALALAGVAMATGVEAMPMTDLNPTATAGTPSLEKVWWRHGYGWRGRGWRGYGYGWRRPFYGYGWHRRYYGWRRW